MLRSPRKRRTKKCTTCEPVNSPPRQKLRVTSESSVCMSSPLSLPGSYLEREHTERPIIQTTSRLIHQTTSNPDYFYNPSLLCDTKRVC